MKHGIINLTLMFGLTFGVSSAILAEHHAKTSSAETSATSEKMAAPNTYIDSDKKAYDAMLELPVDQPLDMLNMIRYKDKAVYEEGSEFAKKNWTGEQAYAEYRRHSSPVARRVGSSVAYVGAPQLTVIGPEYEKWDSIFIIRYPNLKSFQALLSDPEYKKHAFHRSAAVADSRLIRLESVTADIE